MRLANSDTNLCLLAANNNGAAFETIYKMFYVRLLQFAEAMLKNRADAEEVVEDVFIKLWANRTTLPAIKNLNYYLFVSVKHGSLNHLEKRKKNNTINIDEANISVGQLVMNPEQCIISFENMKKIQLAIENLPPKCQLIFKLVKEDSLKYKEVANLLNLSVKTIETQMSLALSKIGQSLKYHFNAGYVQMPQQKLKSK